ncbi:nicotinate-nucleotide--dimethylbenzimidazole phosphoribosyltransferase [Kitasatospora sp. NPDC085895]|uniref:nicotinate-nucleotide--dimethylbenzimidazole phosphoribosyltransferase n=1 Tax=Kitasatospora sp. NPDC085895 TaxID=3155057 RepID=UPI00344B4730
MTDGGHLPSDGSLVPPGGHGAVAPDHLAGVDPLTAPIEAVAPGSAPLGTDTWQGGHRPSFTFLDQPDQLDEDEDVLLMPGPQGAWGDAVHGAVETVLVEPTAVEPTAPAPIAVEPVTAVPVEQSVQAAPVVDTMALRTVDESAVPGAQASAEQPAGVPVEPSWPPLNPPGLAPADTEPIGEAPAAPAASVQEGAAPVAVPPVAAPAEQPAQTVRRPLHAGPPIPDPSLMTGQVPVRSLADRGPSAVPVPGGTPAHGVPIATVPAPAPAPAPEQLVQPQPQPQPVPAAVFVEPVVAGPVPVEQPAGVPAEAAGPAVAVAEQPLVVEAATAAPIAVEPVAEAVAPVEQPAAEQTAENAAAAQAVAVVVEPAPAAQPADTAQAAIPAQPGAAPRRIAAFLADPAPQHGLPEPQPVAPEAVQQPAAPEQSAQEQPAPEQAVQEQQSPEQATEPSTAVAEESAPAEQAAPVGAAPVEAAAPAEQVVEQVEQAVEQVEQAVEQQAVVIEAAPVEPATAEAVETQAPAEEAPAVEPAVAEEPQAEAAAPDAAPEAGSEPTAEQPAEQPVEQPAVEEPVTAEQPAAAEAATEATPVEAVSVESAAVEAATEVSEQPAGPDAEAAVENAAGTDSDERPPAAPGLDDAARQAVHQVIRERRDIRNGFRPDPIPHEVLLRVLEAAHTAPSVGYSQPWDFVVIRSRKTRRKMHELAQRQRDAYADSLPKGRAKQFKEIKIEAILETPVNIVVTADRTRGGRHTLGRHTQPQMAPYSAALAVENLWLAARAEGLGVGWVSFFDEDEMVRELGLPEHLEVVAYLCVGYVDAFPDEPELQQQGWAKKRPLSWVVHEEQYGNRALPGEEPHSLLADTLRGIRPLDAKSLGDAWDRQKRMTKPAGSLGVLEIIAAQLSGLARKCPPPVPEPGCVAIFAGDHGVHAQGVTPWPQEVTGQMVANFLAGGAVVNAFAAQVGAEVCVVDVGVRADLPEAIQQGRTTGLLPRKVKAGTDDMTQGPAMSREEAVQAIEVGIETARDLVAAGNKVLITGDMGIANTTASAALIAVFTGTDPAEVTGRGTGIDDATHARKVEVVRAALALHQPDAADPIGVLAAVGGLEHAAIAGFLLGAASLRTPVILDGVIAGSAALAAKAIAPEALAACIAGHRSAEPGHQAALAKLGLRPLIDLDLRLGEGTGALLALPLVQSAARAMHDVATFDSAGVTEKA